MSRSKGSGPQCLAVNSACPLFEEFNLLEKEVKQLRELIRVDALTNYFNYRYFREALTNEMERTRRTGLPTGLIMIDLDHFKSINDRYGHEAGNMALIGATRLWHDQIRQIDIPCRYGGEEFAIIMPGTRFAMTVRVAERLRLALMTTSLDLVTAPVTLTASFGVACFQADESTNLDDFIKKTDDYLLKAKRSGRNRVCYDENQMDDRMTEISVDERMQLFNRFARDSEND